MLVGFRVLLLEVLRPDPVDIVVRRRVVGVGHVEYGIGPDVRPSKEIVGQARLKLLINWEQARPTRLVLLSLEFRGNVHGVSPAAESVVVAQVGVCAFEVSVVDVEVFEPQVTEL